MDKLKKKAIIMILIEAICLIGLGVYLTTMQDYLSLQQQRRDTDQKIEQIRELVQTTGESTQRLKETVDGIYQSKAMSLAYMVREEVDPELSDEVMESYRDLLDVDNVFILDMDGQVLYRARPSKVDFTRARYNQLRTVFGKDAPSQAFEVDMGDSQLRYYGAMITRGSMAVVAQDPEELDRLTEETSSWKSVLENVSVGLEGYSFVISAKDYTFLYHPDEAMIGLDALDAGVRVEDLEDGGSCWMTVNGQELYCGVPTTYMSYARWPAARSTPPTPSPSSSCCSCSSRSSPSCCSTPSRCSGMSSAPTPYPTPITRSWAPGASTGGWAGSSPPSR